jgi:hypothetical protein
VEWNGSLDPRGESGGDGEGGDGLFHRRHHELSFFSSSLESPSGSRGKRKRRERWGRRKCGRDIEEILIRWDNPWGPMSGAQRKWDGRS